mmetsp:Transcript_141553/g.394514  ORF Transcript_141553/g.394514 Transcript_141553/m.394514 type:complete len:89 (+) Transcript_141553:321-587(+)
MVALKPTAVVALPGVAASWAIGPHPAIDDTESNSGSPLQANACSSLDESVDTWLRLGVTSVAAGEVEAMAVMGVPEANEGIETADTEC